MIRVALMLSASPLAQLPGVLLDFITSPFPGASSCWQANWRRPAPRSRLRPLEPEA